jgi:hypothetical protein
MIMAKAYQVADGYTLTTATHVYVGGDLIELDETEAEKLLSLGRVLPVVEQPKATKKKGD